MLYTLFLFDCKQLYIDNNCYGNTATPLEIPYLHLLQVGNYAMLVQYHLYHLS